MATAQNNGTLAAQVAAHGELLARLTVIVEQDHEDLRDIKGAVKIIAEAVAREETLKEAQATLRTRAEAVRSKILNVIVPLACAVTGGLIGHLVH